MSIEIKVSKGELTVRTLKMEKDARLKKLQTISFSNFAWLGQDLVYLFSDLVGGLLA